MKSLFFGWLFQNSWYKPQKKFEDLVPSGEEEEVLVADIAKDLAEAKKLDEDVEEE